MTLKSRLKKLEEGLSLEDRLVLKVRAMSPEEQKLTLRYMEMSDEEVTARAQKVFRELKL